MADDQQTTTPAKQSKPEEPTFTVEEWAANADILGSNRYAVTGALSSERRKHFTRKQAQDVVDREASREIIPDPAQPDTNEEE